jgi:hypothetical protein
MGKRSINKNLLSSHD